MSRSFRPCVSLVLFALFTASSLWAQNAQITPEQKLDAAAEVLQQLDAGAADVEVIVSLVEPAGKPVERDWDSRPKVRQWQAVVNAHRNQVLAGLAPEDFKPRHLFENQNGFSGRITRKGLENLARNPRVISIQYSRPVQPQLRQGLPLMNALATRPNYGGAGVSIAIVDTGIDYRHSDLSLGSTNFPNGKVIGGYDVGDSDSNPLPYTVAHGTACAGIAAGNIRTNGDYIGGVAPDAKLYALKITSGLSEVASDADIIAAWNWCITHKNDDPNNPILVISLSFGGGRFTGTCDGNNIGYATAAANAVSAGITLLVSSGNEGFCDSISMPACISSVIAVGAVFDAAYGTVSWCVDKTSCAAVPGPCGMGNRVATDVTTADRVTSYSNTAGFLGLLAPSHNAHTTDMIGAGGYSADNYVLDFGGTSAAAPYAAGAVAALQSAARSNLGRHLTPAEVRALLTNTGDPIADVKAPQIIKPRVNLGRAIETLTPPRLSATRVGNRVVVSWPTNQTTGAVLEWVHALPATTWSNVPVTSVVVDANRYVTNSVLPGATKFFRLRK
jgi:subtilisin family serine protease